jgi:hypothetical protein
MTVLLKKERERERTQTYKGQRENFACSIGPQGAAKYDTEIVHVFESFSSKEQIDSAFRIYFCCKME